MCLGVIWLIIFFIGMFDTKDNFETKLVHIIKLYFEDQLKMANTHMSCNKGNFAKNPTEISRLFYTTAYSHVLYNNWFLVI